MPIDVAHFQVHTSSGMTDIEVLTGGVKSHPLSPFTMHFPSGTGYQGGAKHGLNLGRGL